MTARDTYTCNGWACVDCLMWLANGEAPVDMSQEDVTAWRAKVDARNAGYDITLGMLSEDHDDACPRKHGDTDVECDCEIDTFSWSACDVCGSNLGGERHAVSFWKTAA